MDESTRLGERPRGSRRAKAVEAFAYGRQNNAVQRFVDLFHIPSIVVHCCGQ
jgi:hypothetical protein